LHAEVELHVVVEVEEQPRDPTKEAFAGSDPASPSA